ncbi:hypothetical protein [Slackia heliotrinireducens]|uniref:hypothetical protein n=1 Tax=Slackia heliotrinireducens TaxID=84110 RepID=UPI003315DD76
MIDGMYAIAARVGNEEKKGTVTLKTAGSKVKAKLDVFIIKGEFEGTASGDSFRFDGVVKVLFKKARFQVDGKVDGDRLTAVAKAEGASLNIEGTRM